MSNFENNLNKVPRDFILEERRSRFLAFKKAHPPNATDVSGAKANGICLKIR